MPPPQPLMMHGATPILYPREGTGFREPGEHILDRTRRIAPFLRHTADLPSRQIEGSLSRLTAAASSSGRTATGRSCPGRGGRCQDDRRHEVAGQSTGTASP